MTIQSRCASEPTQRRSGVELPGVFADAVPDAARDAERRAENNDAHEEYGYQHYRYKQDEDSESNPQRLAARASMPTSLLLLRRGRNDAT
jgi:hypothetical protein